MVPNRSFRSSPYWLQSNDDDAREGLDTRSEHPTTSSIAASSSQTTSQSAPTDTEEVPQTSNQPPEPPDDGDPTLTTSVQDGPGGKPGKGPYGSAKRRMRRNIAPRLVIVTAPPQYVQRNIKLYQPATEEEGIYKEIQGGNASGRPDDEIYPNATVGSGAYQIHREVLFEVQASVNAGLRPTWAGEADSLAASKPHLVLQSPKEGGSAFLDAVVENVAQRCRADIVSLDAQDIAEFVSDHNAVNKPPYTSGSLRTLGYDAHVVPPGEDSKESDGDGEANYDEIEIDTSVDSSASKPGMGKGKGSFFTAQPVVISAMSTNINDLLKPYFKQGPSNGKPEEHEDTAEGQAAKAFAIPPDQTVVSKFIESLLNETELQRHSRAHKSDTPQADQEVATSDWNKNKLDSEASAPPPTETENRGTILHIKDYLEIYSTQAGSSLLRSIHDLVLSKSLAQTVPGAICQTVVPFLKPIDLYISIFTYVFLRQLVLSSFDRGRQVAVVGV